MFLNWTVLFSHGSCGLERLGRHERTELLDRWTCLQLSLWSCTPLTASLLIAQWPVTTHWSGREDLSSSLYPHPGISKSPSIVPRVYKSLGILNRSWKEGHLRPPCPQSPSLHSLGPCDRRFPFPFSFGGLLIYYCVFSYAYTGPVQRNQPAPEWQDWIRPSIVLLSNFTAVVQCPPCFFG